jgi:hypothetical protein
MVDITPTPRVLRTLGQIPFATWQCLAELIDNSIDGFQRAEREGLELGQRRIVISWHTGDQVGGQIEILDTGPGMTLEQLSNCVRAGYSENDPINNLGLFGMGFNIATARLGDRTLILSATVDSDKWEGVEIDFSELIDRKGFDAPTRTEPKKKSLEHGTKVIISKLDPANFADIKANGPKLRRQLEEIYTPLLEQLNIEILVQGKVLTPKPHCVWSETRYVTHKRQSVPAVIEIDEVLGESLFDTFRNRYLSADEEDDALKSEASGQGLPTGVTRRLKRVYGWLGIQRYADPNDFGVDFVRNGRKILLRDKTVFDFYNQITLKTETEYPVELGGTTGGRIIGQLHVDHVPPTYQKNDFHRSDYSWREVIDVLRGIGPILPGRRKAMGYDGDNESPLGKLINAYRRVDSGTKCLAAPNALAREYATKFENGDPNFLTDEKWWHAAVEQDRLKAEKGASESGLVDGGDNASDSVDDYITSGSVTDAGSQSIVTISQPQAEVDPIEDLRTRSTKVELLSRDYTYPGCTSPLSVVVYQVDAGVIRTGDQGVPATMYRSGNQSEFFYNPRHRLLSTYPTVPTDLLLVYLAERIKVRDGTPGRDIGELFSELVRTNFQEHQLDLGSLQERSRSVFEQIREFVISNLSLREQEIIDCVHESAGEVEDTAIALTLNPNLLTKFQNKSHGAIEAVQVVPFKTLVRIIDRFPEEFFDSRFFSGLYQGVCLPEPQATERLKLQIKERTVILLKDLLSVLSDSVIAFQGQRRKEDLQRISHSIATLHREIVE